MKTFGEITHAALQRSWCARKASHQAAVGQTEAMATGAQGGVTLKGIEGVREKEGVVVNNQIAEARVAALTAPEPAGTVVQLAAIPTAFTAGGPCQANKMVGAAQARGNRGNLNSAVPHTGVCVRSERGGSASRDSGPVTEPARSAIPARGLK